MNEMMTVTEIANGIAKHAIDIHAELEPIAKRAAEYEATAKALVVENQETAARAGKIIEAINADADMLEASMLSRCIEAAHGLHRMLCKIRAAVSDPMERAKTTIKAKVADYVRAERLRLEKEAAEKAERERKALEEAAKKIAKKSPEVADELRQRAEAVVPEAVSVETGGVRLQKRWFAEVVDASAFLEAASRDKNLIGFIEIKTGALSRAKAANQTLEIPGIRFTQREV